jgi:putative ABC transport system substrate-binding protein
MMDSTMQRRQFITLLGGTAATWPLAARAQQRPVTPVVGFITALSADAATERYAAAFRKGLTETGYVEDRNVTVEYHWLGGQFDRLPALAADLVQRRAAVIFATNPPAVRAAMAATATIPIVFAMGEDPVKENVVASLNRPGGNVTGFTHLANQLAGKRLGLLRETAPKAVVFAVLVNPTHPSAESDTNDVQAAARALSVPLHVLHASSERDFETAFTAMVRLRVGALFVNTNPFFVTGREQLAALAARHAVPAMYDDREFPAAGGLMSYGASRADSYRQAGIYAGRILKGEKPADLPVQQSTKLEFIINLNTAKALGLDIPPGVLAIADEVIE